MNVIYIIVVAAIAIIPMIAATIKVAPFFKFDALLVRPGLGDDRVL